MSIGAGTYQDPENFQGLAHFLEHIWFKGSDKYPGEDYYESQIAVFIDMFKMTRFFYIHNQTLFIFMNWYAIL
jgi:predicted Zn-dependent peptidase